MNLYTRLQMLTWPDIISLKTQFGYSPVLTRNSMFETLLFIAEANDRKEQLILSEAIRELEQTERAFA